MSKVRSVWESIEMVLFWCSELSAIKYELAVIIIHLK